MDLTDRVAVVTGGGTGIGRAVCEALAEAGARGVVIGYSRSADDAERTAARLDALGCAGHAVCADVADDAQVRRLAAAALERFGSVDVLVNNAGATRWVDYPDLESLTDEVWREVMGVNLMGAFYASRALAGPLREAGGAIVNVSSISGHRAGGSSIVYAVSKAALLHLTRTLAVALAPQVRVNAVSPGTVATRWQTDRLGEDGFKAMTERERGLVPLARTADPEHVAQAVLGLLRADLVTGETLVVDGGKHLLY
jgi:3-oxoacyl-[acyl-carrier protein] reductase